MADVFEELRIGERVLIDRWKATVKFVGHVHGQQGIWVGLDWDDAERGKHDGSIGAQRYFQTDSGKATGSFVRETKLRSVANKGHSLLAALQRKYNIGLVPLELTKMPLGGNLTFQLVGADKLQQQRGGAERIAEVSLIDSDISSVGAPGELRQAAPCLRNVDLSSNLLSTWDQVEQLCDELEALEVLNVSSNRLQFPEAARLSGPFHLKTLILNRCHIKDWKVVELMASFYELEELHLMGNELSTIDSDPTKYLSNLKVLGLDNNRIKDWQEVCKLGHLPKLSQLLLSGNSIAETSLKDLSLFGQLSSLVLAHNQISDWASVDALDMLPQLTSLRLSGNPHLANLFDNRFQVIARIGKLQTFNGSAISPNERRDAEVQFLRTIANVESGGAGTKMELPLRVAELKARYGDVGTAAVLDTRPQSLGSQMLEVTLSLQDDTASTSSVTKKLPRYLTLGKLKALCSKLFKIPIKHQLVKLVTAGVEEPEDITGYDNRHLSYFADKDPLQLIILDGSH